MKNLLITFTCLAFTACAPHNGKPIGANCVGSTANGRLISTQCAFTYDNEIAANFKF